jgi:hypothetical protein
MRSQACGHSVAWGTCCVYLCVCACVYVCACGRTYNAVVLQCGVWHVLCVFMCVYVCMCAYVCACHATLWYLYLTLGSTGHLGLRAQLHVCMSV